MLSVPHKTAQQEVLHRQPCESAEDFVCLSSAWDTSGAIISELFWVYAPSKPERKNWDRRYWDGKVTEERYQRGTLVKIRWITDRTRGFSRRTGSQVDTTKEGSRNWFCHSLSSAVLVQPLLPQQIHSLEFHLQAEVIKRVTCFLRKLWHYSPPWPAVITFCCSSVRYWAYSWSLANYRDWQEKTIVRKHSYETQSSPAL